MDSKIEFLYLDEEDMLKAGVLEAEKCVTTVGDVVSLLDKGDYLMGGPGHNEHGEQLFFPKKSALPDFPLEDSRDRRFMSMPGYLGGRFHIAGEKWYGSNGRNAKCGLPRSILMVTLNDVETGAPLAYMSANLLSSMRTGAMPGLTVRYLARKDIEPVVCLIGAGVVNHTSVMAILAECPNTRQIKIKGGSAHSKSAGKLADFIRRTYPDIPDVRVCESLEEAVRGSDIISEAVSTPRLQWPVLRPEWLKPGCVVISSGTMDIDLSFVHDSMSKVVDNLQMYEDYIQIYEKRDPKTGKRIPTGTPGMYFVDMIKDGTLERSDVQSLGKIVRGIDPGRTSGGEMFLVSLGGMPILDLGWGYECYHAARKRGLGTMLKLWDSPFLS